MDPPIDEAVVQTISKRSRAGASNPCALTRPRRSPELTDRDKVAEAFAAALGCHFAEDDRPNLVRLHPVRDERWPREAARRPAGQD